MAYLTNCPDCGRLHFAAYPAESTLSRLCVDCYDQLTENTAMDELSNLVGKQVTVDGATSSTRYRFTGRLGELRTGKLYVVRDPINGRIEFGPQQIHSVDGHSIMLKQWCE